MNKEGLIVTTPINQLYQECEDQKMREELMKDNLWCLNTFFNLSLTEAPVKEEYYTDDFGIRF